MLDWLLGAKILEEMERPPPPTPPQKKRETKYS